MDFDAVPAVPEDEAEDDDGDEVETTSLPRNETSSRDNLG